MLDDFTPIIHELPGRTVKVWALGDAHIGAKESDLSGLNAFVQNVAQDSDSYLVIVGDMLNNGLRDSLTNVYEETMPPHEQVDYAAELLAPISDRILGVVGGNHEHRSVKAVDLDPLYQVMVLLRKPELYRQNFAFVRVVLVNGGTHDHYALFLAHGKTANKQRQFPYVVEGVDATIFGHTHSGEISKSSHLHLSHRNTVSLKPVVSITATSWLGYGGYAARSLMFPKVTSDPQCLVLEYTGTNNRAGKVRVAW